MKKLFLFLFFAAIVAAFSLNLRHSLNDYGVRDSKLHLEILAQSNTSGGGTSGGGTSGGGTSGGGTTTSEPSGWFWAHVKSTDECSITTTTTITLGFPPLTYEESVTITLPGHIYTCVDGWSMFTCSSTCKAG
jgi:hypothetical protein